MEELTELVEQYQSENLVKTDYTEESWTAYAELLDKAKEMVKTGKLEEGFKLSDLTAAHDGLTALELEEDKIQELENLCNLSIQQDDTLMAEGDANRGVFWVELDAAKTAGTDLLIRINNATSGQSDEVILRSELDNALAKLKTSIAKFWTGEQTTLVQDPGTDELEPVVEPMGFWSWFWIGLGVLVALIIGAVVGIIIGYKKSQSKRNKRGARLDSNIQAAGRVPGKLSTEETEGSGGAIQVEKLHEQGARSSQQDSFFVTDAEGAAGGMLAVVADGMGGLADGDKVSQAAVAAVVEGFYQEQGTAPEQLLIKLLDRANRAVNDLLGPAGIYKSGSTIVIGLLRDGMFHYLSVGDSRISLFRDGNLYQLNREHVYRNELYLRAVNGEGSPLEAESHPKAAGLTSFLGMGEIKHVDIPASPVIVRPGDRFILMSDGVYNALPEMEFVGCMSAEAGTVADALRASIQAKNYSNQDNYTAVILEC